MARGGYRPGSGPKKGTIYKKRAPKIKTDQVETRGVDHKPPAPLPLIDDLAPLPENPILPLEYMLRVLNDPKTSKDDKAKMASLAAPYCHARAGDKGKKEGKDEAAKKAASGRFAPSSAPNVVPMKKQG